jgi:O-antigen/teichoic acid export membrane protein
MHRLKVNSVLLANASSLVGATAITSGLGFVYWWIAAHRFLPDAIGAASASVSAMTLLGGGSILGLNTLLITELPRRAEQAGSIMSTALLVVGVVGTGVGCLFALGAVYVSPVFQPLGASFMNICIFSIGVGGYAITVVLDQALIGLLKGGLQFWRNAFFSAIKLVALFATSSWPSSQVGMKIYATWVVSTFLSLGLIAADVVAKPRWRNKNYMPQWSLLRNLSFSSFHHHMLNVTLQAPTLLLPLLVTTFLSARTNAWFYVSWMIVSFVFVVPGALTTVLHAMNAAQQSTLARGVRLTISVSLVICALANLVLQCSSAQVLGLFGNTYAAEATWGLRILALAAFPLIIKNHYISLCRIQDRIVKAMVRMLPGGLLELAGAAFGARQAGLPGLSLGWVGALTIEAMFMFPTIYKVMQSAESDRDQAAESDRDQAAETMSQQWQVWQVDTAPMVAISTSFSRITEATCLSNPLLIPTAQSFSDTNRHPIRRSERFSGDKIARLKPPRLQPYALPADMPLVDRTSHCVAERYREAPSICEEGSLREVPLWKYKECL